MDTVDSAERVQLEKAARLHWFHWAVVGLSLVLTISAWYFTKHQIQDKVARQFDRETQQSFDLIQERMEKYEDALWGGVALFDTVGMDVSHSDWQAYAQSIRIDAKYPGINGVGVIYAIAPDQLQEYLAHQRVLRSDYTIYPEHDQGVLFPITYIEPSDINAKAVGLDIAFEANRRQAAFKARDTGEAQITGPIVLVQDSQQTPGFLFYAPFYERAFDGDERSRAERFKGMVYSPFVMSRLMEGVLDKENRHVGIGISDGDTVLYDEHTDEEEDFDADPLFTETRDINLYGRTWTFEIWSAQSFREAQNSSQPIVILLSGIIIDILLVLLFFLLTRGNRRALRLVDMATHELQVRNDELEQFVYTASHDLKSPLLTIQGFAGFLQQDLQLGRTDRAEKFVDRIIQGTNRMRANVDDLLELSRVGRVIGEKQRVDVYELVSSLIAEMSVQIDESKSSFMIDEHTPMVNADPSALKQVFENLLSNALKYAQNEENTLLVRVGGKSENKQVLFFVEDNGPGIPDEYKEKVFGLFQRLSTTQEGTGIGLSLVSRIAQVHGGKAWVEDTPGGGATFWIAFPA